MSRVRVGIQLHRRNFLLQVWRLHAVDVDTGEIRLSTELPPRPNELSGVEG
jgi:hypothetical protein